MIVKYAPENGPVQTWEYKPKKVRQSQAEMIEKRSSMTFDEFNKALLTGSARPRKVLLWFCYLQQHPVFRFEDVPDFLMDEVTVEFDRAELQDIRAAVVSAKDMPEDVKEQALVVLDEQLAGASLPLDTAILNNSESGTGL